VLAAFFLSLATMWLQFANGRPQHRLIAVLSAFSGFMSGVAYIPVVATLMRAFLYDTRYHRAALLHTPTAYPQLTYASLTVTLTVTHTLLHLPNA
jgi:hypothetical protein